jgi:hypothetical protein
VASLGFFAGPADAADVLAFAIGELGCQIYDAHSPLDQRARQFDDVAALNEAFPRGLIADSLEAAVMLTLWAPSTGGAPVVERITLKLKGHSFREIVSGWGAMRLNLGVLDKDNRTLESSWFAHNSEKRALAWEDTSGDKLGPVSAWDWDELERISRKMRYHLRQRLGITKLGSAPVLPEAAALQAQGFELRDL